MSFAFTYLIDLTTMCQLEIGSTDSKQSLADTRTKMNNVEEWKSHAALKKWANVLSLSSSSSSSSSSSEPSRTNANNKRQRRTKSNTTPAVGKKKLVAEKAKAKKKKKTTTNNKTKTKKKRAPAANSSDTDSDTDPDSSSEVWCLPRNEEKSILSSTDTSSSSSTTTANKIRFVIGVDEAGRGPLAGPVVAAAAIVPVDIDGITDSKKITKESDREDLYKAIVESKDVRWAVAVMDAPFIDKVNILQATMRGMSAAVTALIITSNNDGKSKSFIELGDEKIPIVSIPTIEQKGCYVITNISNDNANDNANANNDNDGLSAVAENYYALVDGNRVPTDMPCESNSIVKGDSKEYAIAAASILAKVTRDRLMRDYHELWPSFGLKQHKGYPTAAHMQAVKTYGATPIHRRTFRPLKDMTFDKDGKIIDDSEEKVK